MRSFIPPTFRIATAAFSFCAHCSEGSRFCKSCSPMADIRDQSFARRRRKLCQASRRKSSSVPMRRRASRSCLDAGSSNEPFPGSVVVEDWPRIGRTSTERRSLSCASPPFASCSESYAIPHDVFGRTLRGRKTLYTRSGVVFLRGCDMTGGMIRILRPSISSGTLSRSRD